MSLGRFLAGSVLMFVVLFSTGCGGKELLTNVDARDSLDALVALGRAGIRGERSLSSAGVEEKYTITVKDQDFSRALEVIHEYGFPRQTENSIEALSRSQGFIPLSPEISGLRADKVLSQEAERLLEAIAGVVNVKAHVRSNFGRSSFESRSSDSRRPKARVEISYLPSLAKKSLDDRQVRDILLQVVPDLNEENIEVVINRSPLNFSDEGIQVNGIETREVVTPWPPFVFNFQVPKAQEAVARTRLGVLLAISGLIAGVLGFCLGISIYSRILQRRTRTKQLRGNESFFIEANGKNASGKNDGESAARTRLPGQSSGV